MAKQTASDYWRSRREREKREAEYRRTARVNTPARTERDVYGFNGGDRDHS